MFSRIMYTGSAHGVMTVYMHVHTVWAFEIRIEKAITYHHHHHFLPFSQTDNLAAYEVHQSIILYDIQGDDRTFDTLTRLSKKSGRWSGSKRISIKATIDRDALDCATRSSVIYNLFYLFLQKNLFLFSFKLKALWLHNDQFLQKWENGQIGNVVSEIIKSI